MLTDTESCDVSFVGVFQSVARDTDDNEALFDANNEGLGTLSVFDGNDEAVGIENDCAPEGVGDSADGDSMPDCDSETAAVSEPHRVDGTLSSV